MITPPELTQGRIAAAFVIAVLTDLIQLPLNVLFFTGFLAMPAEAVDLLADAVAFTATTLLLGFHWALLPTAMAEAIPVLNAVPTWTGCVAFVVCQRKQEQAAAVRQPLMFSPEPEPRVVTVIRQEPQQLATHAEVSSRELGA